MTDKQRQTHGQGKPHKDRPVTMTEEASDFTRLRGTIAYSGCTCCCCCCLWTPGGIIGGAIAYQISKKSGDLKYGDMPECIRHAFQKGAWLTFFLSLFGLLIYFDCAHLSFNDFLFALAAFLPAGIIPITFGGLLGAYVGRALHQEPAVSQVCMWPIWRALIYAWLGTLAGIGVGIGLFMAL